MFFRRPKSYTITLQRAHSLLKIPRDSTTSVSGEAHLNVPSRDQIQDAFRAAAKRHHPDLATAGTHANNLKNTGGTLNTSAKISAQTFRECHEARELLLDHYVRRKYIHPEILSSTKNTPEENTESLFSVWKSNNSFQIEAFLRLSLCLGLAVGSYFHDLHMPERRRQQIQRRDAEFYQFGPQPRY